ncbi:hypothetical protein [Corynebacterium kroppenstedtii]|jgi:membrane protein|uniref:Uncharacterized protein n=1 Tax=Corynebacterium kroppenstedtii TaxID=161879 RepID=A0A2W5UD17_9CORY|nr:hypothetical protein [Corynebacterium kroppenstedtii]MDU7286209.1 hypothetical protein [Corynebacterium kroppenstedtii]PZR06788.1 MAG: hypothetical protein DI525_00460 [Corynebacterium kroppenstedtii]
MSNSVFPYFRLCGWREALLLCCVVIPLVWFHDFSLPQLFGPELSIPVFLPNLVPVVMAGAMGVLLGSQWSESYERAVTCRSTQRPRLILSGICVLILLTVAGLMKVRYLGWETVSLISAHSIVAIGCAAVIGGRWGSAVSLRLVPLLSLTLCLSPWIVGESTALGNSVGIGTSFVVLIGEAVLRVIGLVIWVRQGR